MANKSKKPCNYPGCISLVTERFCSNHKQQHNKEYDRYSRETSIVKFYHSAAWKRVRQLVLIRDNYLCQHCLNNNSITPADMVHHIEEVKQDWNKRLELSNLISLCNSCHNKVHGSK